MMWKPDTRKAGLMRMNLLPRSMNIALEFAYQVAPRTFKWQACPSIADHCKILQVEGWIRCSNRRIDGVQSLLNTFNSCVSGIGWPICRTVQWLWATGAQPGSCRASLCSFFIHF